MKAAVGFRDGELSVVWSTIAANVSLDGLNDGLIVDAAAAEDALAAYDAAKGTNLAVVKAKRQEVLEGYTTAMAAGYDTGLGFSLKLGEEDQRVLFDYQQRLLRQLSQPSPEVTLADIRVVKGTDDAWHLATVEQIIAAIDGGAGHVESLNGAYAGYEAMLAAGVVDFEVDFLE